MADNVIRIEFQADEPQKRLEDLRPRGDTPQDRQEQDRAIRDRRAADDVRNESSQEAWTESQRRIEDRRTRQDQWERQHAEDQTSERIAAGSDEPALSGKPPVVEPEVVDERPRMSTSRALVPYDQEFAARTHVSGSTSEYAPQTATGGAGGGNVPPITPTAAAGGAEAGGPGGVGAGGLAGIGAGGPAMAGGGAASLSLLTIAEVGAGVVVFLGAMSVALVGATEALGALHDALISDIEPYSAEMAQARAQQEAELIETRAQVAEVIGPGAAQTISAQTDMQKEMIKLRGLAAHALEGFLNPMYRLATLILRDCNWLVSWFYKVGDLDNPTHHFQQEAEEFLNHMGEHRAQPTKPKRGPGVLRHLTGKKNRP